MRVTERQTDVLMFLMRLHRTRAGPQNATQARLGPDYHFDLPEQTLVENESLVQLQSGFRLIEI